MWLQLLKLTWKFLWKHRKSEFSFWFNILSFAVTLLKGTCFELCDQFEYALIETLCQENMYAEWHLFDQTI